MSVHYMYYKINSYTNSYTHWDLCMHCIRSHAFLNGWVENISLEYPIPSSHMYNVYVIIPIGHFWTWQNEFKPVKTVWDENHWCRPRRHLWLQSQTGARGTSFLPPCLACLAWPVWPAWPSLACARAQPKIQFWTPALLENWTLDSNWDPCMGA